MMSDAMALRTLDIKSEYRSLLDNISRDFYVPLLSEAISYKRAVGFFSSSALIEISTGIAALVQNGGSIQIVASPYLSEDDITAIKKGYELRDKIIKQAVLRQMTAPETEFGQKRLNLLANLIADGVLDIKIAFTENESNMGMYHEKMGIITDANQNRVAFSGSMNESLAAMKLNYEAIDVFCSWRGEEEARVKAKESAFVSIWSNCEPNIRIVEFPELKREIIERYRNTVPDYDIDVTEYGPITVSVNALSDRAGAIIPSNIFLHDYQKDAIQAWKQRSYRGIFDMATGTGKTYTGLGALAQLCNDVSDKLAVIIVCPFQHLVEQWVEDIEKFNMKPIIGYSSSSQKDWKRRLENAIRDQKLRVRGKDFFCFICTNATFSSDFVQLQLDKIRGNALLIVDEAHNFGAERLSGFLLEKYNYRLALSATLERHNDEYGTSRLYSYFGDKCIEYTLERAIEEEKLTRYKYFPVLTTLSEQELSLYSQLSYEINKCVIYNKRGEAMLSEKGKRLALKRSRLVGGSTDKITQLEKYITPYVRDKHILVYCGATTTLSENQDSTNIDDEDIRQIDAVAYLLGNRLGMNIAQFTSREDIQKREILKREFSVGETLQALVAIKCLDEGVNIPKIKTAFILASTTNPKEYIQRRGRVLRLAEGKDFAEIYDFITLPRQLGGVHSLTDEQRKRELPLVKKELCRAEEFARLAMNMAQAEKIIDAVKEAYSINEYLIDEENYIND